MKTSLILLGALLLSAALKTEAAPAMKNVTFRGLSFKLPAGWKASAAQNSTRDGSQEKVWRASGQRELHISAWSKYPTSDGGVMVAAQQWEIVVAGQKTFLTQTRIFQGSANRVLVTGIKGAGQDSRYRIYTRNVPRSQLTSILSTMKLDNSSDNSSSFEAKLTDAHPSEFYTYANKLFVAGHKDEAVFWFYVGELRYRFYLRAHPDLKPDGDPALFASLHEVVGRTVNGYAGQHRPLWIAQINKALAWDDAHANGFTSKTRFKKAYQENRAGLISLRQTIEQMKQIE